MLKKIHSVILACAFALAPVSPASAMYEEICIKMGLNWHISSFIFTFMNRDNPNGLEPRPPTREVRSQDAFKYVHQGDYKCIDPADLGARPGDRLNFKVHAYAGKTVTCRPTWRNDENFEGFWLMPDGPRQGRISFQEPDLGTITHHRCVHIDDPKWSDPLRMHSECNATINGMSNAGCAYFHPEVTDTVLHEIVGKRLGYGMLGSALNRGADVNKPSTGGFYGVKNIPLHIAAWHGHADYAKHLIDKGAAVNARNKDGHTPLMLAAARNHPNLDIIEVMLDNGANPNYPAFDGAFPLYHAALNNRVDAARLLLANGAQLNGLNAAARESSLAAAKRVNNPEMIAYLRGLGAREGNYDQIIYDIVDESRGGARLRGALNDGADVNFPGPNGKTALHLAAERGERRYVSELARSPDLDINRQDDLGLTPLFAAFQSQTPASSVIRLLISRRADANLADAEGNFPAYVLVRNERLDLLQLLAFARGLDLNQRHPGTGLTAMGLALQMAAQDPDSMSDILKFLERRNAQE